MRPWAVTSGSTSEGPCPGCAGGRCTSWPKPGNRKLWPPWTGAGVRGPAARGTQGRRTRPPSSRKPRAPSTCRTTSAATGTPWTSPARVGRGPVAAVALLWRAGTSLDADPQMVLDATCLLADAARDLGGEDPPTQLEVFLLGKSQVLAGSGSEDRPGAPAAPARTRCGPARACSPPLPAPRPPLGVDVAQEADHRHRGQRRARPAGRRAPPRWAAARCRGPGRRWPAPGGRRHELVDRARASDLGAARLGGLADPAQEHQVVHERHHDRHGRSIEPADLTAGIKSGIILIHGGVSGPTQPAARAGARDRPLHDGPPDRRLGVSPGAPPPAPDQPRHRLPQPQAAGRGRA